MAAAPPGIKGFAGGFLEDKMCSRRGIIDWSGKDF